VPSKERLDQLLVKRGLAESRETAQGLILAGQVLIGQTPATKAGKLVPSDSELRVMEGLKYASRGGLKLETALDDFKIEISNKVIIDIGSSTGGFTDCVLQRNARKVYCVDVGYGQLSWKLRHDPRVVVMERTNARTLTKERFADVIDLAVIDVSFISAFKILQPLAMITNEAVLLFKPQFEAGPDDVPRGGVIRDPAIHEKVLRAFIHQIPPWQIHGLIESPILGGSGNKEFLVHLSNAPGWTEELYHLRIKDLIA